MTVLRRIITRRAPAPARRITGAVPWLAVVAWCLCGCGTAPRNPYLGSGTPASLPADTPVETMAIVESSAPVLGHDVIETNLPPEFTRRLAPISANPNPWGTTWVPLERWANQIPSGRIQYSSRAGNGTYSVNTPAGLCTITVGNRLAHWNATPVGLGFAPRLIEDRPHLHFIDVEKTLQPLLQQAPSLNGRGKTIVIDAGHGGADAGTRGGGGEREKDYTLDWALRLEQLLAANGWNVVLTRRTDTDLALPERVAIADRVHADLFISLHFNSTHPNPGPSGIETYCLTPQGAPSTLLRGYADDVSAAFPNNAFDAANLQLAYRVQRAVVAATRANDLGVKRARFMAVLRYQARPAILIEGGFLSNPDEAGNIRSPDYRQALAVAVARALQ